MSSDPFALLGLDRNTASEADVKKAYARQLKQTRPDEDPAGFMALREALEHARRVVRWREEAAQYEDDYDDEDEDKDEAEDETASTTEISQPEVDQLLGANDDADPFAAEEGTASRSPERREYGAPWGEPDELDSAPSPEPQEDDSQRNAAYGEIQSDAAIAEQAVEKLDVLLDSPERAAVWQNWLAVLDSEDLEGIDTFSYLSDYLRNLICQRTEHDPSSLDARVKGGLTPEILLKLDARFGWSGQTGSNWIERQQNIWLQRLVEEAEYQIGDRGNSPWGRPPVRRVERTHTDKAEPSTLPEEATPFSTIGSFLWLVVRIVMVIGLIRAIGNLLD